jgi:hypothetical protein
MEYAMQATKHISTHASQDRRLILCRYQTGSWSLIMRLIGLGSLILIQAVSGALPTPPKWVVQRPRLSGYWVGIASAAKEEDPAAARTRARDLALYDIAVQIQTRLKAETLLLQRESAIGLRQDLRTQIQTQSRADLQGVSLVDTWEDADACWVYARLSVVAYQNSLRRNRQAVLDLRCRAQAQSSAAAALELYLQALAQAAHAEPGAAVLEAAVRGDIRRILDDLRLEPLPVTGVIVRGVPVEVTLEVKVWSAMGKGIAWTRGLPLHFSFADGGGILAADRVRVHRGGVRTRILALALDADAPRLRARISWPELGPVSTLTQRQFDRLTPTISIPAETRRPRLNLRVTGDIVLGEAIATNTATVLAGKGFAPIGLYKISSDYQADLSVEFAARIVRDHQVGGMHFVFAEVRGHLSEFASGRILSHLGPKSVKGAGATPRQALAAAGNRAAADCADIYLPQLLKNLHNATLNKPAVGGVEQ